MRSLQNFIALYFNLSRKESNGFILLCALVLIFIFAPVVVRSLFSSKPSLSLADQQTLDSLVVLLEEGNIPANSFPTKSNPVNTKNSFVYTDFDPNTASVEELTKAGVPDFISRRIVKFRSKGGKFKTKEDVKKIYGLSEITYQRLYPHIRLEQRSETSNMVYFRHERKQPTVSRFDLNLVDSLRLVSLKGIGPSFTSRILKYRNKLGGYISLEQLKEVYGLDSTAIREIDSYGFIDQNFTPAKINLNSTDENSLQSHPYIGKKIAKLILSYRSQHGNFTSVEQLKNIRVLSEQIYLKIHPYLRVE